MHHIVLMVSCGALRRLTRRARGLAVAAAILLPSCTTFVRPTTCKPGSTSCNGEPPDERFCEYVVLAAEGADCASLGMVVSRHFCVVRPGPCVDTTYAVTDHDCRVLRYETLRDSTHDDCPPGAPMFASR